MSEERKNSTAPWRESQGYIYPADRGEALAWLVRGKRSDEERESNKQLIVNAPESMDALEEVVDELDGLLSTIEADFGGYDYRTEEILRRAQSHIYRVTGRVVGRPSGIRELTASQSNPEATSETAPDIQS